ncbi:DUF3710 domain-containing protein [Kitasatospora phosalacinea]|uniref:DUF3710 domain-containing protein n=1 Tax=Kitasatospora phosalacinea TaxID=2065 RepID=A0ABW6GTT4_9ACTN
MGLDGAQGGRRGIDTGPWDVREGGRPRTELADLGGLLVPLLPGEEVQVGVPRNSDQVVSVTVVRNSRALQLQAWHAQRSGAWTEVRQGFAANVLAMGGEARECAGPYGTELRCEVLGEHLTTGRHAWTSFSVFGCDGPGWVLRAVASGVGADRGPADWAYAFFAGTVVVPSAVPTVVPASPAGFGSFQPGLHLKPVLLRVPDGGAAATTTGPLPLGDRWW